MALLGDLFSVRDPRGLRQRIEKKNSTAIYQRLFDLTLINILIFPWVHQIIPLPIVNYSIIVTVKIAIFTQF